MGVKGLVKLLAEEKQRIYQDVEFRNSRLVVDGSNLLYLLYFQSGLDQNHGGDYGAFEGLIERFVAALRLCDITPYVVLDGCDVTDGKHETQSDRFPNLIERGNRAAVDGVRKDVLPRLAKLVFKQTLVRLDVPLGQCYAGADQEVASLASEWCCPVLSEDSDFFIFELPNGLLRIAHFRWQELQQKDGRTFLPCKIYRTDRLCNLFGLRPQLLPSLAALVGNDYVNLQKTKASVEWGRFDLSGNNNRLRGLLSWLRRFQEPGEALEAALGLKGNLSVLEKATLLRKLTLGAAQYQLLPSTLKSFFEHGTAPPYPAEQELRVDLLYKDVLEGPQVAAPVPDWMRVALTQGRLNPEFLNVLQRRRMFQSIVVEPADRPSSSLTSRPLRQVMYGLLLGGGAYLQVEEVGREGLIEVPTMVSLIVTEQLDLQSLDQVAESTRLRVLLKALQVTEASLSPLPPEWRLPGAVTCLWVQRAEPVVEDKLLKALLLGMSSGTETHEQTFPEHSFPQRAARTPVKEKPDLDVLYAFNQWQACLQDSVHLNQLLGCPLPEPTIARLYEGTRVHRKMREIELYLSLLSVVQGYRPKEETRRPAP